MGFLDLQLQDSYDSGFGDFDVVENFYSPVLGQSKNYDRVAGYFSSRVFASAARGIAGLVRNGGKMRLITSHAFTPTDTQSIQDYFGSDDFANDLINDFVTSFSELGNLTNTIAKNHIAAMCWMLREGILEIKIVVPESADLTSISADDWDKFHPKFGVFHDGLGNSIAFSGSVNETAGAWRRNIENFDVFMSWIPGETERRIEPKSKQFEKMWEGRLSGQWKTIELPAAVKEKIVNDFAPVDFPDDIEKKMSTDIRKLRHYQTHAVDAWIRNSRVGILEMATGTGKTRTARACIENCRELERLLTVVIVPYQHIGEQWVKELSSFNPLMVTGDWKKALSQLSLNVTLGRIEHATLVVVKNTAAKESFKERIQELSKEFKHTLVVGDEVHWLGARAFQASLFEFADFRLGLSATPNRYFDEEGTSVIFNYFVKTVYELTLRDALALRDESGNQVLCPYSYHPILTNLTESESEKYREFTLKIARMRGLESTPEVIAQLENLYILRSNISKSAENKIPGLQSLISNLPKPIKQTIIYCADFKQLEEAAKVLNEFGIYAQQITGEESAKVSSKFNNISEREHIISNFAAGNLDVLLAIDCLDEGVDIPSAHQGIILASSGNEKEFIQRRGRLMRPFRAKESATIYDFCVLPEDPSDPTSNSGLIDVELKRIDTFGEDSLNPEEVHDIVQHVRVN